MRIVLDTNIYLALALQGEFTQDLFEIVTKAPDITTIVSEEILQEVQQKLKEKFHWNEEDINLFISKIRTITTIIIPKEKVSVITRDPKDNKILECALAGNADLIVTADQDLIKLKNFKGIGIIHPKTLSWTFPEYFKNRQS